jgi:hypothetical protein
MNVQMEEYFFSDARSSEKKNFIKNTIGCSEQKEISLCVHVNTESIAEEGLQ